MVKKNKTEVKGKKQNKITKVKGTEKDIFMVPSTSSTSNPHRVKINENGLVECDEQCLNFKCYKICSHSVAVAEFHRVLYQFIDKFKEKKKRKIRFIEMIYEMFIFISVNSVYDTHTKVLNSAFYINTAFIFL